MSEVAEAPKRRTRSAGAPGRAPLAIGKLADAGLFIAFLALTFLLGVFPLKDTDFWWHLRTGDLIRQTGTFPTVDTYTFGAAGHTWVDLHWIYQVLISYGYQTVGVPGINVAKCIINCLAIGLLISARKKEWPLWMMLLAWLPGLLVVSGRMYVRPETLTLLYMAAYLAILFRIDERPKLAFLLPVVQLFWVNTQGLFVLGPGLLVFALIAATLRPGAFDKANKRWWTIVLSASVLTGLTCLVNPYGIKGALYPLQLMATMSNDVFSKSIAELQPVWDFIARAGLSNGPIQIQIGSLVLGIISFFVLIGGRGLERIRNRAAQPPADAKKKRARVKKKQGPGDASGWAQSALIFRLILFLVFYYLSWKATRNSHQFGAIAGTITAWNFGEWGAERMRRRAERGKVNHPGAGRLTAFAVIAGMFVLVATGAFYHWSGEGRTVGLGEERLWYPHEAVAFAGRADMPQSSVCFHNGHAALYEYAYAPERKTYADARLEVVGPELYKKYVELDAKIGHNAAGWEADLEGMKRPLVLVDNVHVYHAGSNATLLTAKNYSCVWFDPVAALYVHNSYAGVVKAHGIDFGEAHFHGRDGLATDFTAEKMQAKNCWDIVHSLTPGPEAANRPGWREMSTNFIWKGLDHTRELRRLEPNAFEGWKWAGMLEFAREPAAGGEPIPRYRMEFDPVFDLLAVRTTYLLKQALDRRPNDGNSLTTLGFLNLQRGLFEAALPNFERYIASAPAHTPQEKQRLDVAEQQRVKLFLEIGPTPESLKWSNLSELDRLVNTLYRQGRAGTAADVLEGAYPSDSRPWVVADRIATIRLHLGEPARAHKVWAEAKNPPTEALKQARQAVALFAQTDYDGARRAYQEAIRLDPKLFEAYFGLIVLESDLRHAPEAYDLLLRAEKVVPHTPAGSALDRLRAAIEPYARPKQ